MEQFLKMLPSLARYRKICSALLVCRVGLWKKDGYCNLIDLKEVFSLLFSGWYIYRNGVRKKVLDIYSRNRSLICCLEGWTLNLNCWWRGNDLHISFSLHLWRLLFVIPLGIIIPRLILRLTLSMFLSLFDIFFFLCFDVLASVLVDILGGNVLEASSSSSASGGFGDLFLRSRLPSRSVIINVGEGCVGVPGRASSSLKGTSSSSRLREGGEYWIIYAGVSFLATYKITTKLGKKIKVMQLNS